MKKVLKKIVSPVNTGRNDKNKKGVTLVKKKIVSEEVKGIVEYILRESPFAYFASVDLHQVEESVLDSISDKVDNLNEMINELIGMRNEIREQQSGSIKK